MFERPFSHVEMPRMRQSQPATSAGVVIAAVIGCGAVATAIETGITFGSYYLTFHSDPPYYLVGAVESLIVGAIVGSAALFTRPKTWAVVFVAALAALIATFAGDIVAASVAFPVRHYGSSVEGIRGIFQGLSRNKIYLLLDFVATTVAVIITIPRVVIVRSAERMHQQPGSWPAGAPYGQQPPWGQPPPQPPWAPSGPGPSGQAYFPPWTPSGPPLGPLSGPPLGPPAAPPVNPSGDAPAREDG
jgi:hypothetical protein